MKKLLNIKGIEKLSKNVQKNIIAGYSLAGESRVFACYCGFVDNPTSSWFATEADSINDALNNAGQRCHGAGATCQGMR